MDVLFLFLMIIGLLLIGVPIAVSLGFSSILFLLIYSDASLGSMAQSFYQAMAGHYTLLAIPFFILASTFMSTGGVAQRIIRFSIACVGHFRGGLAIAGVFACMMFAALSGSSPATVVAIGTIVIAAMRQVGYTKDFAAGVICNAGTLGILIPPSIVMVVYASATDVSVGRMFLAGVFPGLLAGLMLIIAIWVIATIKNMPKGEWRGWGEISDASLDSAFGLLLILVIMIGIYGIPGVTGAIFTPTEAAAVAAVYAFLVANLVYRDIGPMKEKGWLTEDNRDRNLLGMRALLFTLFGGTLTALALGIAGYGSLGRWIGFALAGALTLGFAAILHGVEDRRRERLSAGYVILFGGLPFLYFVYSQVPGLFGWLPQSIGDGLFGGWFPAASAPLGWVLATVVILLACGAVLFLCVFPVVIYAFGLSQAAGLTKLARASYGATLAGGGASLAKGVGASLLWLIPSFFHKDTKDTLFEAGKLTITLMFIIANALILKHVLTEEQIPQAITEWMLGAGLGPITFLIVVNIILLIGGQFMEPSGLLVIVAPLVFPIAIELGIDPIHLGIIMVVNMEIGMITPPVGLNLFVTSGVAGMSMMAVVRAALPFLAVLFVFLILITYVPIISTWLPTTLMGPEIITF